MNSVMEITKNNQVDCQEYAVVVVMYSPEMYRVFILMSKGHIYTLQSSQLSEQI